MRETIFSQEDFDGFLSWLNLNITSITWEGRYTKEFDEFWKNFFVPSITLSRLQERFNYLNTVVKTGPLHSWFNWLNEKIICFSFIEKGLNLREISVETNQRESVIALVLRDFYVERLPHLEDEVNDIFQVSNVTSKNIFINHKHLIDIFNMDGVFVGTTDEEIMTALEVTLYPEWMNIISEIKKNFYGKKFNLNKIKERASFQKQRKFATEVVVLFFLGAVLIAALRYGNSYYENYLSSKISLFQPNFFWLDKNLSYKENENTDVNINLTPSEIEELEKSEGSDNPFKNIIEERFDVESEVTVTSIDDIPQRFAVADFEHSSFEENKKLKYRGIGVGSRKAYRVMLDSVDGYASKAKLNELLKLYGVTQADNVKPGTQIPGGLYYNLYVPMKNLREFLAKINTVEKTMIYESKSRKRAPVGMARVFIWVKSI
jgi:hypothetical protein